MRGYEICPQEQDAWCIPATLQTLLKSRGVQISQPEIARSFPLFSMSLDFNQKLLNDFLNKFRLNSEFYNPFMTDYGERFNWRDLELDKVLNGLEEENKDLLTAYKSSPEWDHLALVSGFDSNKKTVRLVDNKDPPHMEIGLLELFQGMHPGSLEVCQNSPYGFYVVSG